MDHRLHVAAGIARRARLLVVLTGIATLAVAACTSQGGASPSAGASNADASLEETPWQLTEYVGPEGGTLPVPEAVAATATFSGGTVTGSTGCNQYHAAYTLDGATLTIGEVAMTLMACPEPQLALETAFTAALAEVASYAISGETLELKTAEGTVGLRFTVAQVPTLTATRWVATMINNGTGGVASVVEGSEVTATFAEDGTVAGSGGCNTYSGSYTVDGSSLDVGPLAATQKLCDDEAVSQQEASYFAALDRVTTFALDGDHLQVRDADGALQVEYRSTLP